MTYIPKIGTTRLADDAVTSAKVLDGTLTNADIAAGAAIALSKLATDPLARANHTGTQLASTISDFNTAVQSNTLDSLANPVADIDMDGFKITDLGSPSAATDAATKGYVDAIATGLVDYKASARAVATSNITLSGAQTIDGVSVIAGDRVLVTGQTAGADNGIYVAAAGAWSRSADADTSAEVTAGMYLAVEEGTSYADSVWLLATDNPITLGTTSLTFIELPSVADLIAGAGLTKTGTTIDVGAGTGITVNANDVAIDTAVVPRKGVANTFTANNTFAGINFATTSVAANYTVDLDADHTVFVNPLATGGITITIPATHSAGDTIVVKDTSGAASGTDSITLNPADADTIDGSSTYVITNPYEAIEIRSNGTNWFIV